MNNLRHQVVSLALLAIACPSFTSCGGAQKKSEIKGQTLEEYEANTPPPDDPCYEKGGEPLECTTEADCCQGFVCTKDPERSQIIRYCLQG